MPTVSVVVPVRDEAHTLARLWASLGHQTCSPYEVIFVDGGSADGTQTLVRNLAATDPRVTLLEAGRATPGRGRNIGVEAAGCDWVAFTDGGMRLDPRWLESLVAAVEHDPDVRVVYGHYEPVTRSLFEECAALAYVSPRHQSPAGSIRAPSIASSLVHRAAWQAAGGFPDRRSGEDLVFMGRLRELGVKTAWVPSAVAWWELAPTLGATFRRFSLYAFHGAQAGEQGDWHHGVARHYAAAAPFVALGAVHRRWWLLVPALGGLLRAFASVWRRREDHGLIWALAPARLVGVAMVLATTDAATFVGWGRAVAVGAKGRLRDMAPGAAMATTTEGH